MNRAVCDDLVGEDGVYQGPSTYLVAYYQRKKAEHEYWNRPEMRGPSGLRPQKIKEIDLVRCALQTIWYGMQGEETRNSKGFYCRLVEPGALEEAYKMLRRYEKLLAEEPLVEQIASDWGKAGAFSEGPKGVI